MPILGHLERSHNVLSRSLGWGTCSHHHFCEVVALGTHVVWCWETAHPLTGLEIEVGGGGVGGWGVHPSLPLGWALEGGRSDAARDSCGWLI